jgi:hypothetical protein
MSLGANMRSISSGGIAFASYSNTNSNAMPWRAISTSMCAMRSVNDRTESTNTASTRRLTLIDLFLSGPATIARSV